LITVYNSTDENTPENIGDLIEKDMEVAIDQFKLKWKFKDVNKELTYDIKKCIGCSLCKIVCPVDAIELGPISEIAQNILDDSNPKLLIDHAKCCYCMLCAVVCPTDAFHENIQPEGQIDLEQFPSIGKFYKIDMEKCIEDSDNAICELCLDVRKRNHVKEYYKIQKECPAKCFSIDSPIKGKVILKEHMLHRCDPLGCKACVNICPVESWFIPESAEDIAKYGKIACNEESCFYCGSCENSCPDDLIIIERKDIEIVNPKKKGNYPWIKSWSNLIKELLRKKLISRKKQIEIPKLKEELREISEKIEEEIPQLSEEDKKKLLELNKKIQNLFKSSKIRYWIKDKKVDKISKEIQKVLS